MRARDVEIGATYTAKVSKAVVKVKILSAALSGGWTAKNMETGRTIRIRGVQRLREKVEEGGRNVRK